MNIDIDVKLTVKRFNMFRYLQNCFNFMPTCCRCPDGYAGHLSSTIISSLRTCWLFLSLSCWIWRRWKVEQKFIVHLCF